MRAPPANDRTCHYYYLSDGAPRSPLRAATYSCHRAVTPTTTAHDRRSRAGPEDPALALCVEGTRGYRKGLPATLESCRGWSPPSISPLEEHAGLTQPPPVLSAASSRLAPEPSSPTGRAGRRAAARPGCPSDQPERGGGDSQGQPRDTQRLTVHRIPPKITPHHPTQP